MTRRTYLLIAAGVAVLILAPVGWYLGSPLFIDRVVEEELPSPEELERMSPEELESVREEVMSTAEAMPDESSEEPMPAEEDLEVVLAGAFQGADDFHQGEGQARILQLADGSLVLRFEDFSVTNGPDLHVYLAENPSPTGRDDLGAHLDLGALKGNIGSQNYTIPDGLDLDQYNSVIIYCVPFHVLFASAELSS